MFGHQSNNSQLTFHPDLYTLRYMKTYVVVKKLTGNVEGCFTETLVGQREVRYDLIVEASRYFSDSGGLHFYQDFDPPWWCLWKSYKCDLVATLAPGTWEGVYDATDCEAW